MSLRIGLISDTHGLLRPAALDFLRGCDHIVHGGDIGNAAVLDELAALAPLTAVRGNNDHGAWADALPEAARVQLGEVASAHSHKPLVAERGGVVYVNPGSAGPRRFKLPIAVGELMVVGRVVTPRVVELRTQLGR